MSDSTLHQLSRIAALAAPLSEEFSRAGFELYAVGGSVRDALLGLHEVEEIDFTTNARPDDIERLMAKVCGALWVQGREFGTIGGVLRANGIRAEVTTFRSEEYVDHSRKPAVEWGDSLRADLSRRDFTINAIALDVISIHEGREGVQTLFDFFGGVKDLMEQRLVTPVDATILFRDDPLRMLRAARFAARFGLRIDPAVEEAATSLAEKITIVSTERVRAELDLLMVSAQPSVGLDFIVRTGLAAYFLPELPALQLEQDPIHRHKDVLAHTWAVVDKTTADLTLRLAALFHDVGKPATRQITPAGVTFRFHEVVGAKMTRKRMTALKYPTQVIEDVSRLVELHLRFHTYKLGWSDSAVRRYVHDAGPLLEHLNELTRCDCTTRNQRKAVELAQRMDQLEERILDLRRREDLDNMRPALNGDEVMELLSIPPSRDVKRALEFLLDIRREEGEISKAEATHRLREWWNDNAPPRPEA